MPARVLVVDDDEEIRSALTELLVDEGYETLGAANGQQALALLHETAVDVVLLDLMMPVMNGWQLLASLRADARLSRVPVIVMTAGSRGEQVEAQGFLRKPLDVSALFSTVEQAAHAA